MARGGPRAQSGPPADPRSARSETRGLTVAVLSGGYTGKIPGLNQHLPRPSARQRELWDRYWRYPHACVWVNQPWRHALVAELVRLMVMTEQDECPVGIWTAIRQHREDLGLSTAGSRQEGWEISAGVWSPPATAERGQPAAPVDEVGERRQRRSQTLHEE